ncbi:MAG: hypothetical protein AMXMBFR84_26970 [Candidatus Hydrogenedentota bacterium]
MAACLSCMNPFVYRVEGASTQLWIPSHVTDIRQAAPPDSIGGQVLRLVPRALERLPLLPEVAMEVNTLLRDPDVDMGKLAQTISRDQVITVKILKLANSALFAGLREITDVKAACTRIGLKSTSNMVQAIAASGIFRARQSQHVEYMRNLWKHAVAAAHCATEIAAYTAEPNNETMYAAALTHDIGKVLILDIIVNGRVPAFERVRESRVLFDEIIANYHGLLGLHVVQHWNLPPDFAVSTYCHAHPQSTPDNAWQTSVAIVSLGSALANASGYGVSDVEVSLLSHPATKYLGFNDIKLATLRVDLEDKLAPLFDLPDPA